jgi:Fe2+ or Zn2+ uptake regulation protein
LDCARQIVRYRYLDPDASAEVVAQKLCQDGWKISIRSVYRVFAQFGLQKK